MDRIIRCDPAPDEILVHVDGASTEVLNAVRNSFPQVILISSPNLQGPGGSRNKLIETARNELVANFDDDSFPEQSDYFARVQTLAIQFPDTAILSAANHDDAPSPTRFTQISAASGCGCVFRKSWYLKAGGFIPLPIAYNMEEVDMGLRLHAIGGTIVRDAELRVIHDKPHPIEVSAEVNACVLANTALFPLLRFPFWLWPVGIWQVLHRLLYLISRGWVHGLFKGLKMIPSHLQRHISWRVKIASSSIISWLILRRFPRSASPHKSTE